MANSSYKLKKVQIPKSRIMDMSAVRIVSSAFARLKKGIRKATKSIAMVSASAYANAAKATTEFTKDADLRKLSTIQDKVFSIGEGVMAAKALEEDYKKNIYDATLKDHKDIEKTKGDREKLEQKLEKYIEKYKLIEEKIFGKQIDMFQVIKPENDFGTVNINPSKEDNGEQALDNALNEQGIQPPVAEPAVVEQNLEPQPEIGIQPPVAESPVMEQKLEPQPVADIKPQEVEGTKAKIESLSISQLMEMARRTEGLETENGQLKIDKEATEKAVQELTADNKSKEGRIGELTTDNNNKSERINQLEQENETLSKVNKDQEVKISEIESKLAEINSKFNDFAKQFSAEQELRKDAERNRDEAQTRLNNITRDLENVIPEVIKNALAEVTKNLTATPVQQSVEPVVPEPLNREFPSMNVGQFTPPEQSTLEEGGRQM